MFRYHIIPLLLLLNMTGCSTTPVSPQVSAQDLIAVGNHAGLIQHYKRELAKKPDSIKVMLKLAQSYYDNGDVESASFYVEQLKKQNLQQPSLYFLSGNIAADSGLFELAVSDYQTAVANGYQGSQLYINSGIALTNSGQYQAALEAFNQARLMGHDDITVKNNLAVLYLAQGEYLRAVELLTPVYRQHTDEKKLAFNLAISLFKVGDYREAHRLLSDDYSDEQISALFHSLRQGEQS
ncbi:tetratricopeptide repeat protein [Shewanella nanhaiensis]|uniref:Tetratricopeptide repeat protein n=1 Tax=Shewanella nanhaiensis TaxID=2864872 RepID=A0ABS7E282_9GAMM|nr:tetratricopeptide repeat protein [Shewanella nanhaiensis]MBW8183271.1 tetratricopeptide repeat protein [Shewanella nanhaiensis]